MRVMLLLMAMLSACDSGEAPQSDVLSYVSDDEIREKKATEVAILKVEYPTCAKSWDGKTVSNCGIKVFEQSLSACREIGTQNMVGKPALIDKYTGDSWQLRAGPSAVRNIEERIAWIERDSTGSYLEPFAYALGDGTDEIETVFCGLDSELRLNSVT